MHDRRPILSALLLLLPLAAALTFACFFAGDTVGDAIHAALKLVVRK